jgi:anti-sigma factor RsiW
MSEKNGAKTHASKKDLQDAPSTRDDENAATAVCPDAVALAGYLDGKLTGEEAARFEAHLARCAKCRLEVKELREILAAGDIDPDDPAQREALDDLKRKAKGLISK